MTRRRDGATNEVKVALLGLKAKRSRPHVVNISTAAPQYSRMVADRQYFERKCKAIAGSDADPQPQGCKRWSRGRRN